MRLKEIRKIKNLTQYELSKKIGIPLTTYSNYELNKNEPSNFMLVRIADALDVSVDYLLDHKVAYKTEMYDLTEKQKNIMQTIKQLPDEYVDMVQGYVDGILERTQESQQRRKI